MKDYKRKLVLGFTLIELLVVISIISLLSSVVLSSLRSAREKANDTKSKQQLSNLRAAAALYYDTTGQMTYGPAVAGNESSGSGATATIGMGCATNMFASASIRSFMLSSNYPTTANGTGRCTVTVDRKDFTASVRLSNGTYWCVDSKGVARVQSSAQGNYAGSCSELS
ncbi:MAG: prepilin-type N-terminal cleavage/methylation domain-containing protein [bacterium]|nr:prepilin-type N-terminal cleavage/methylation domain-containing protein [bacterium]